MLMMSVAQITWKCTRGIEIILLLFLSDNVFMLSSWFLKLRHNISPRSLRLPICINSSCRLRPGIELFASRLANTAYPHPLLCHWIPTFLFRNAKFAAVSVILAFRWTLIPNSFVTLLPLLFHNLITHLQLNLQLLLIFYVVIQPLVLKSLGRYGTLSWFPGYGFV